METDYFKVPHNKHLGKKPKDWHFFKYSKEKNMESTINWQTVEVKVHGIEDDKEITNISKDR